MKIILCTVPLRKEPCNSPPLGAMAVIASLRAAGYDPYFYDIDGYRFPFSQVEEFFAREQPELLGISAVVSTSYNYVKRLSQMVRRVSPKTRIVVGGNLAASAEVLHRLAGVDYCVSGDGEIPAVNLAHYVRDLSAGAGRAEDYAALANVKGISFIRPSGEMVFTGFERRLEAHEFFDPDFGILERFSDIDRYIFDPLTREEFASDPRTHEGHRRGKKGAQLETSKGCVARCTFCHRWEKGYRVLPVETILRRLRHMMDRYNVGFVQIADEAFGADRRHVNEFIDAIKPLDILYIVAGVRTNTVDLDLLKRLRASGCVAVYYGMETGSPRILKVMEKNLTIEHSVNAARWTAEAGLSTICQLVLGMPGENPETIGETIEFLKGVTGTMDQPPIRKLSLNFIQALPGTPIYEYARRKGLLGKSLADEEAYLTLVSDTEADDDTKFINFTDWDYLTVQSWRRRIVLECTRNWIVNRGIPPPTLREVFHHTVLRWLNPARYAEIKKKSNPNGALDFDKGGYFNLQTSLYYDIIAHYLYLFHTPIIWLWVLGKAFWRQPFGRFARNVSESIGRRIFGPRSAPFHDYRSIRKILQEDRVASTTPTEAAMASFREGR